MNTELKEKKMWHENIKYNLLNILYFLIWILGDIFFFLFVFFNRRLYDAYIGKAAVVVFVILNIICVLSIVILIFMKTRWLRYLIPFSLTIVFFISFFTITLTAENYFNDFTAEKWSKHPEMRDYMIDDLKNNHNIIETIDTDVIILLGEPDAKVDNKYHYYMDDKGNSYIEIAFVDNKVISITIVKNYD